MKIGYVNLGGLTTTPEGDVAYDFDGHVHARGVDLDAAPNAIGTVDNLVRWVRQSDGAMVAAVYGWSQGPGVQNVLQLEANDAAGGATRVELDALSGGDRSTLAATAGGGFASITANAGIGIANIITQDGGSSFVQAGGPSLIDRVALYGPYLIDSGQLSADDTSSVVLSHNIGRDVFPVACPVGGAFGYDVGWSTQIIDANNLWILFRCRDDAINVLPTTQVVLSLFLITRD